MSNDDVYLISWQRQRALFIGVDAATGNGQHDVFVSCAKPHCDGVKFGVLKR